MYLEGEYLDAVFGADAWCHGSELFSECPTLFLSISLYGVLMVDLNF